MFSLHYNWIDLECPGCNYSFEVMLRDFKLGDICYCHNCKKQIMLIDESASVHTGMNQMDQAVKDLEMTLKKMFK